VYIYWVLFLVLAVGALFNRSENSARMRAGLLLFGALPTALMIGLRWKVGPDWVGYSDIFNYTRFYSLGRSISHFDPAFITLNWLLHQFNAPFWTVNAVCGTIFVAGLTAFCRRQPNPWLAFLVAFPYLVIAVAMSGDRQSAALGIMFFAFNAFDRERLTSFVILLLLAALFHGSILLILPICLLSYSRNGLQRMLLLAIAGGLAVYFFHETFGIYARRYSGDRIQSTGVAYRLAMNTFAAAIFLVFQRRFELKEHQRLLWRNISLCTIGLILLVAVVPSSTAVDRFLLYLFPLQSFVLSRVPNALSPDGRAAAQATGAVILYAALIQVTFLFFATFARYYIPYRTIFHG